MTGPTCIIEVLFSVTSMTWFCNRSDGRPNRIGNFYSLWRSSTTNCHIFVYRLALCSFCISISSYTGISISRRLSVLMFFEWKGYQKWHMGDNIKTKLSKQISLISLLLYLVLYAFQWSKRAFSRTVCRNVKKLMLEMSYLTQKKWH